MDGKGGWQHQVLVDLRRECLTSSSWDLEEVWGGEVLPVMDAGQMELMDGGCVSAPPIQTSISIPACKAWGGWYQHLVLPLCVK